MLQIDWNVSKVNYRPPCLSVGDLSFPLLWDDNY